MFGRLRLTKIHAKFLESCRSLREGKASLGDVTGFPRWLLEIASPAPLLSLHPEGKRLLSGLEWLEANCRTRPLGEESIRNYHKLLSPLEGRDGGRYRSGRMQVASSAVQRPPPERVPALMKQLDRKLAQDQKELDAASPDLEPVLQAAVAVHQRIAFIHPFPDGNGRVARLSLNHLLRRYGQGYVILPPISESREHFELLEKAHLGELGPFLEFARSHLHRL